jgi:hypothetical protein
VTEELSWEVFVDSMGKIEIPSAYVLLSEIPEQESFQIKLGRKHIRLVADGDPAIMYNEHHEKGECDGEWILKFLTETNSCNRSHVIIEEYTRMLALCQGDRYEVRVGKKQIRLTPKF